MNYIAVLDYEHLDNGMFLSAFAAALAEQEPGSGIIIHGDSEYTNRIMQKGIMREDARIQSIKGLNHRLIALFADQGVAAVGLNGYQREFICRKNDSLVMNHDMYNKLPSTTFLLLSNLVHSPNQQKPEPVDLDEYAHFLQSELEINDILVFNRQSTDLVEKKEESATLREENLNEEFINNQIPKEFRSIPYTFRLTNSHHFANYPSVKKSTLILKNSS